MAQNTSSAVMAQRAIIDAYNDDLSYNRVAAKLGISPATVRITMERHAPDSIRPRNHKFDRPPPDPNDLTLKNLGLHKVGPCLDCGTAIVSSTGGRQRCGFCEIAQTKAAQEVRT